MVLCLSGSTKIKFDFEGVPKLRCARFCMNYAKHDTCDFSNMTLVTPKKVETLNSPNFHSYLLAMIGFCFSIFIWGLLKGSPGGPFRKSPGICCQVQPACCEKVVQGVTWHVALNQAYSLGKQADEWYR